MENMQPTPPAGAPARVVAGCPHATSAPAPLQPGFLLPVPDPTLEWEEIRTDVPPGRLVNYLRAALGSTLVALFTIPCMVLVALGVDPDWVMTRPMRWWGMCELWALGLTLRVENEEKVPRTGPFILMANHQSLLDVFVYSSYFRRPIFYVLKKEFGRIPFLGWFLRQTDQVFLDRKNLAQAIAALDHGVEKLRQGKCTVIFPEGTRRPHGTLGAFKKGPFHLALKSGVPVLPVTMLNSGALLPTRSLQFSPGTIRIVVSDPIDTSAWTEETLEDHMAQVRAAIARPLATYREQLGHKGL